MQIQFSGELAAAVVDEFKKGWDKIFPETKKMGYGYNSAKENPVIQIVGELNDWSIPLQEGAIAFLDELAVDDIKDIVNHKKEIYERLQQQKYSQLFESTRTIWQTTEASGFKCNFILTLYLPLKNIELGIVIANLEEVEICWLLSNFIANIHRIHDAVIEELSGKNRPSLIVFLTIDKTGSICMKWIDSKKTIKHERLINQN